MRQADANFVRIPQPSDKALDLKVGSLVEMDFHDMPMVIEGFEDSPFGRIAQCCGFQSGSRLWVEDIPVAQITGTHEPGVAPDLYVGLHVLLRPAGPVMSVVEIVTKGEARTAICEWDGDSGIVRRRAFPVEALLLSLLDGEL